MRRRHFVGLALLAALHLCGTQGAVHAQERWKTWDVGALTFEAPFALRVATDTVQGVKPMQLSHPDWFLKIVGSNEDPDVFSALFEYSPNVIDGASGTRESARSTQTVDARPALRIDWLDDDTQSAGFDLVVRALVPGSALFKFTCQSGKANWKRAKPTCERMAACIVISHDR
jgi:hypothetical protein